MEKSIPPLMFDGGDETNRFLNRLGFTIVQDKDSESSSLLKIPILEPVTRSREYNLYQDNIRDRAIFEYLFNSESHRWIDEHVVGLMPHESRGYQAMGILHYVGLKNIHKGIFKGFSIHDALTILEQQSSDFRLVIQSLQRFGQRFNGDRAIEGLSSGNEYIELEKIIANSPEQINITETEREQVIKSRVGQSTFKRALLSLEKKCKLCGVTDERFLVASHIKPWSQSTNLERLDADNGLLLCPSHDALFDKGYISFDEKGTILISDSLNEVTKAFMNINDTMNIEMNETQQQYIEWHRVNIFRQR